jgi:drug/metabolite transporter (DMT)-like permease
MDAAGPIIRNEGAFDRRLLWLLPLGFVLHDGEELATMPEWTAANRDTLSGLFRRLLGMSNRGHLQQLDQGGIALAMSAILFLFVAVTAAAHSSGRRIALQAYALVLGGFFLHGFGHAAQSIAFGGYTPGVVTAMIVVIPVSLLLYAWLLRSRMLGAGGIMVAAAVGAALVVPGIVLARSVGGALAE